MTGTLNGGLHTASLRMFPLFCSHFKSCTGWRCLIVKNLYKRCDEDGDTNTCTPKKERCIESRTQEVFAQDACQNVVSPTLYLYLSVILKAFH